MVLRVYLNKIVLENIYAQKSVHSILECCNSVIHSASDDSESEVGFSVSDDKYTLFVPPPTLRLNRKYNVDNKLWNEDHEVTHEELEKTNNTCNSSYYRARY